MRISDISLLTFLLRSDKSVHSEIKLDRGAGFISRIGLMARAAVHLKGETAEEAELPWLCCLGRYRICAVLSHMWSAICIKL